uniref:GRIP domain-containing protein n=1 Tax=Timema cristinae TaxID=61476 RepID=A0A7R9CKU0_TIMCR|nr:unnamed protein product [Timema cristinae]
MDSDIKDAEGTQKKSPLESLSKDELVNRCKNLLSIAQKAKHAKDEANKKVKTLEDQLNEIKLQNEELVKQKGNSDCKKCLEMQKTEQKLQRQVTTMQEMLSMLTDQKLTFTMEMDKLKKQNEALKKQHNDNRLPDEEVKAKLEDLDIAVESYRRQNKRLAKENDDLIQQLDTMEAKLRTREQEPRLLNEPDQADDEDVSRDEVLEGEVKSLREEVERLNSENKKKNEQMKELYEKFNSEKTQLEEQLQSVSGAKNEMIALGTEISKLTEERTYFEKQLKESETLKENLNSIIAENDKLKFSNRNLSEQLQAVFEEKKEVLYGIESINQNNFELNKLVQSIASERDECLMNIEKVATEKIKLLKLLDTVNAEKTVIVQENMCLKADKEKLNENIKLVIAEKNSLEAHIKLIERHLRTLLNKSICFLENSESKSLRNNNVAPNACVSEESNSFCIVSELRNSLNQVCTLVGGEISEEQFNCNQLESVDCSNISMLDLKDNHSFINPDISVSFPPPTIQEQIINMEEVFRLHSELELLNTVITNLEMIGKNLEDENKSLKNALNLLNSQDGDVDLVLENVEFRERTCDCGHMGSLKSEDEPLGVHALKLEEGLSVSSTATGEREQSTQYESNKLNTLETCDHQEKHEGETDCVNSSLILEHSIESLESLEEESLHSKQTKSTTTLSHPKHKSLFSSGRKKNVITNGSIQQHLTKHQALGSNHTNTLTNKIFLTQKVSIDELKEKCASLEKELSEKNQEVDKIRKEMSELETKYGELVGKLSLTEEQVHKLKLEASEEVVACNKLFEKLNLSGNYMEKSEILNRVLKEVLNSRQQVESREQEIQCLKNENQKLVDKLEQLQICVEEKESNLENMKGIKVIADDQTSIVAKQTENISMLENSLEAKNDLVKTLDSKIQYLEENLSRLTSELGKNEEKVILLQMCIEDQKGQIERHQAIDTKHADTVRAINELQDELTTYKKMFEDEKSKVDSLKTDLLCAQENFTDIKNSCTSQIEKMTKQKDYIALLQNNVEDQNVLITKSKEEIQVLKEKLHKASVENSNYKKDIQSLQRIIEEKTTEVEKIDKENKNLAEKYFENLKKLNELQFELSTTKKIGDERKLEIEALKAELCNTQTKFVATQENQTLVNTKQKDDITILQNTLEEQNILIANSERKIQNLESEIAHCTLENNNYKDKIVEFQILIEDKSNNSDNLKVLEELKLELENTYEKVCMKDSEMKSLKSELLTVETNLSQIHDKYNHQNTQVSSQAENIEMLKTTVENQNTEITNLKRELELNREALEHFTTENNEYKQTVQNLQKLIEDKSTEEGKIYCDYERLDKEHAKTLQVLNELEVELANKKKQIDEASLEIVSLKAEVVRAEENISEMQEVSYTQSEIVYKQIHDITLLQQTVEDSTVQNTNLRRVMDSLCDKLAEKATEALEVGREYKDLNEKHNDTLRALNEKQIEFNTIFETIHKRDSEIESHKAELLNLQANLIEMKNVCDNQIATIANQNEIIISLQKTLEDQARLLAGSESEIKNKISEYEKEMNSKQVESETIRKTLIEKNSEIELLKTKLLNIQGTLSKIQDACDGHAATIFKQSNDIDILNKTLEDKSSLLTNSEIQIQALEDKLSQTVREDSGYKDQVVDLQKSHKEEVIEFEKLFQKYQELNQKYSDTVKVLNDKHIELDKANETVKEINSEIESLRAELFTSQQSLAETSEACSNHIESKQQFQEAIDKFKEKIKSLECQQREMENHLMFTSERDGVLFSEIAKKHESLLAEQLELKKLLVVKESKLQEVSNELKCSKQSKEDVNSRLHELHTTVMSLRASHSVLRGEVEVCRSSPFFSEETVRAVQEAVVGHVHAEVARAKLEVKELLGEMNEMNQVLKQRGESVSLLKEMVAELEQKLTDSSARLATAVESLAVKTTELEGKETRLQEVSEQLAGQREELRRREEERSQGILRIEELERRILDLERECEDARKEGGEAPSEVMSSSTTSKAEETSRLKDLEESFEERYTKSKRLLRPENHCRTSGASDREEQPRPRAPASTNRRAFWDHQPQLVSDPIIVGYIEEPSPTPSLFTGLTPPCVTGGGQGETEKKKMIAERSELVAKISQMSDQAKSLQAIHQEYDRLQDQLEKNKSETKSLQKSFDVLMNESAAAKLQLQEYSEEKERLCKELDVYVKDKQRLEASFKELRSQIQNMAKEKEADNITRKEMEIDLNRLGEEVKLGERKLSEEIERHQSTRELLEASKQECKKRSVLNLEMEDYEKSVSDLTQQLSAERATLKELEGHLETQREINKGLQDQVHMMEQRVLGEEARATEFKEQLSAARTRQADSDAVLSERNVTIAELIHQLEQQKEHCESLSLQLAELSAEKNKLFESSKAQQDLLMRQVVSLEDQLTNLKYSLGKREGELSDLQEEFRQYKVRAQSVLRQKARGDESSSFSRDELLEETNELRKTADTLRTRLEETGSQLQSALQEQATLKEERTRALQRCQVLSDSLSEAREENHRLQEQVSAAVSEQREALRSQKIQHDTLIHCYKSLWNRRKSWQHESRWNMRKSRQHESWWNMRKSQQHESWWNMTSRQHESWWEVAHPGWVATLRLASDLRTTILNTLVMDVSKNMNCGAIQAEERVIDAVCTSAKERYKGQLNSEAQQIQQLEELEGRLATETATLKGQLGAVEKLAHHSLEAPPVRRLSQHAQLWDNRPNNTAEFTPVKMDLNMALSEREEGEVSNELCVLKTAEDGEIEVQGHESSNMDTSCLAPASTSPGTELSLTKEQLSDSERRIRHLSALLSEAEQDLAKLTQLNGVLKEEIRRQQRSVEREQHAQNFEYLKNVVLKFVTLQGGDERSRLVPVLNTILKLSPEETVQLNQVAKGIVTMDCFQPVVLMRKVLQRDGALIYTCGQAHSETLA